MGEENFLDSLQSEVNELKTKNYQLNTMLAGQMIPEGHNSIEYQLESESLLIKIENFLKGAKKTVKQQGNDFLEVYEVPKDENGNELYFLNENGVNSIMVLINQYVDKNTMLSDYSEERINEILADLGDELAYYLFNNYEKIGMDSDFKKSRYTLTVLTILHTIESAYRKAIRGKTSENINTSKIFSQSDMLGMRGGSTPSQAKKKFSLFKPSTW